MANRSSGLAHPAALMLVLSGALGSLGWLWWNAVGRSEIAFLPRRSPAEWILYPSGPDVRPHPRVAMKTVFTRSFHLEQAPPAAALSLAAFHQYTLSINGAAPRAPARPGRNWKQSDRLDVARMLHAGENQIAVEVVNTNGPPALWLSLAAGRFHLSSDESWQASYAGAAWRPARLASKPKVAIAGSPGYGGEEPWASLRARWLTLLLFAALSAAGYWLFNRRRLTTQHATGNTPHATAELPSSARGVFIRELLPVLVPALLWVALFANNLSVLPPSIGYDLGGHLAYIRHIQEYHSLPLAGEGWEMFQPPLYYVLSAALLNLLSLSVTQDGGIMALRVMGLVIGVAHFTLVWASLRLLFPGDRYKPRWGLVLAAALPPLLFLSHYVTNEGLAAALVSACVYLTLRLLQQPRVCWKLSAGLGLCLGAALLTKPTALLAVVAVLGALLWKWLAGGGAAPGRWVGRMCLILGVCLAVSGWHYARLWAHYGSPLIGVWDPRLGISWWQDDGYRTGVFYLRFGEVLWHPWFSTFQSFGDGVYSTLWGDGLFGGATDLLSRPPWNYDLMAGGYWLASIPTLAVLGGAILVVARFVRQARAEWFLVLALAFLAALALVHLSLALPYQCHVKAFYGLCALVPFCAFGACGFDALCRWSGRLRPAICILLGVWALDAYASFWVPPSSVAALLQRARSLGDGGRALEGVELLKAGLALKPGSAEAQSLLAYLLLETGDVAGAGDLAETAVRARPNDPKGHLVLAAALQRLQQPDAAIEHLRRAVALAPGDGSAYQQLAELLLGQKRYDQTIQVSREGLAVAPFSAGLRYALGTALIHRGETAEGSYQQQLAGAMPNTAQAHCQLAALLSAQNQVAQAIAHYTEALRLDPDFTAALNNLAWLRAADPRPEFRDGAEAVRLAERACAVTGAKAAVLVGTLGAAYAEAGRFDEAVATARKARNLALAGGQKDLAEKNEKLMELFSAGRPYREGGP